MRLSSLLHPNLLFVALIALLASLAYRLVFVEGGLIDSYSLMEQITRQQSENQRLHERNHELQAEIAELKSGMETVEELARFELGMVKTGETLFLKME